MLPGLQSRLTYANVIATLALFFAVSGGVAVATGTIPGEDGEIQGCYKRVAGDDEGGAKGQLRVVISESECKRQEQAIAWNQKGSEGETGPAGERGLKGETGATGETGPQGSKGDDGTPGSQGEKGDTGPSGPAGLDGPAGADGQAGPKGDTGEQGDPGPQGPSGSALAFARLARQGASSNNYLAPGSSRGVASATRAATGRGVCISLSPDVESTVKNVQFTSTDPADSTFVYEAPLNPANCAPGTDFHVGGNAGFITYNEGYVLFN